MPAEPKPDATPTPPPNPDLPSPTPGDKLGTNTVEDITNTNSALDDLLKQAEVTEGDEIPLDEPAAPVKPATPPDPAKPAADPVAPVADPAKPGLDPAKPNIPDDDFEKVVLPPYTKPKSVEAFATVKQMAREKLAAVEREKAELTAKLAAAEAATKPVATPEAEKELTDLRNFRLKFDVEADPSFKAWDTSIKENEELIYAKMKAAGVDEASIKKIQELGGPGVIDWEALASKFPAPLKRYIEGKVFENEDLAEKKKAAVAEAQKNSAEFVRTRQEEIYKGTEGRQKETLAAFDEFRPNMAWLKEAPIPPTATPEEKAKLEASNALVKQVETDMQEAFSDDSPRMRAILISGFAQLMRLRTEHDAVIATHKAEVDKLNASIKEKDAFIARIKNSSTARLSSASPEGKPKAKVDLNEDAASALDRHYKEALAAQEK